MAGMVSARFQELDWQATPMGEISLRQRWDPVLEQQVHEIKLGDEFLMSSMFTAAEVALAQLALAEAPGGARDVAVGGLGLGYTAEAVLASDGVRSLLVVEALPQVIEWHRRGLIPAGAILTADPRCQLVSGDFFAMLDSGAGLDPADLDRRFDAILVDIDHSPQHLLHPSHAGFYHPAGLRRLRERLRPAGVFGLWSNDPPDEQFTAALAEVFAPVRSEVVRFPNPLQGREATNTVYLASRPGHG